MCTSFEHAFAILLWKIYCNIIHNFCLEPFLLNFLSAPCRAKHTICRYCLVCIFTMLRELQLLEKTKMNPSLEKLWREYEILKETEQNVAMWERYSISYRTAQAKRKKYGKKQMFFYFLNIWQDSKSEILWSKMQISVYLSSFSIYKSNFWFKGILHASSLNISEVIWYGLRQSKWYVHRTFIELFHLVWNQPSDQCKFQITIYVTVEWNM